MPKIMQTFSLTDNAFRNERPQPHRQIFFMDESPKTGEPILLNGAIFINCSILKVVVTLAAEAELGALFLNCHESS